MMRNDPQSGRQAHLFTDADVEYAYPDTTHPENVRSLAELPVGSLCSRVESYGPFDVADPDDTDAICKVCLSSWRRRQEDGDDP